MADRIHDTQASLLERLRSGEDALAWEDFHSRYWRLIFSLAKQYGCRDDTAGEVIQEVMLAVFQGRNVFRYDPARGRFRDWLAAVVRNQTLKILKRPSAQIRGVGGSGTELLDILPGKEEETHVLAEKTFQDGLLGVLLEIVRAEVSPDTFQAFELLILHDLPAKQVAATVGISRNAVYKASDRVMARMQELGATYRERGQLGERLKKVIRDFPPAMVERYMTHWRSSVHPQAITQANQ